MHRLKTDLDSPGCQAGQRKQYQPIYTAKSHVLVHLQGVEQQLMLTLTRVCHGELSYQVNTYGATVIRTHDTLRRVFSSTASNVPQEAPS